MLIVGERINGTSKRVREAILARDQDLIADLARRQAEAGADYLDVNAGTGPEREAEDIAWLVKTVQAAVDRPVCIDSPSPQALRAGVEASASPAGKPGARPLLNSASAEASRMEAVIALAREHRARLIALTLDDSGLPTTAEQRIEIAERLTRAATREGLAPEDVFIDPLARAVGIENDQGRVFLDAVAGIRQELPEVHVICGLSNISFRMPARGLLNRTFLAMAMARGLEAAILDPLDGNLMAVIYAAEALLARDEMCLGYVQAYREGRLSNE